MKFPFSIGDFGEYVGPHCTECDAKFVYLHDGRDHFHETGHEWAPGNNPQNAICSECEHDEGCRWIAMLLCAPPHQVDPAVVNECLEQQGVSLAEVHRG